MNWLAGMFPSSKHRTHKKIVYLTCKESYLICLLDLVKLGSSCQAGLLRWEAGRQVSIHLDSGNEVNYTGYRIMHKIAAINSLIWLKLVWLLLCTMKNKAASVAFYFLWLIWISQTNLVKLNQRKCPPFCSKMYGSWDISHYLFFDQSHLVSILKSFSMYIFAPMDSSDKFDKA